MYILSEELARYLNLRISLSVKIYDSSQIQSSHALVQSSHTLVGVSISRGICKPGVFLDGDTNTVLHNGKAERIRLHGIDCPEKRQAFGRLAWQFTSNLVFGKTVTMRDHGRDRSGAPLVVG